MLFLRERHRNNQMMDILRENLEQMATERKQAAEQAAEERKQAAEQAAEERKAFLDAINKLADSIGQSRSPEE